jgi:Ca2+-transporting ATPase
MVDITPTGEKQETEASAEPASSTNNPSTPSGESLNWYSLGAADALQRLDVQLNQGLNDSEAARRLEVYGSNELEEGERANIFQMIFQQLTDPMVLILLGAATISFFLGDTKSVFAIMAIVTINAYIGVSQEYRAEQAMNALRKLSAPSVRVRRNGQEGDITATDLVPGDIVLLEAGSVVPADGRVVESASLQVQEASLTGESLPVEKNIWALTGDDVPLGDRVNMVYLGTAVTNGRASVVTTGTGMKTELGRIAALIQDVETEKTPLQRRMAEMGRALFYGAIGIVVVALIIGLINRQPNEGLDQIFIAAVAMAVAVVPEGLPAVVTIALALGAQRMLKRRALIRKLPAVETLGSVTTICSDKTGTLTENRMTVTVLDVANMNLYIGPNESRSFTVRDNELTPGSQAQALMLTAAELANDATLERAGESFGDPTELALLSVGNKFDLWKTDLEQLLPRVAEVPFSSERKRMSTFHHIEGEPRVKTEEGYLSYLPVAVQTKPYVMFMKGAVDSLLDVSNRVMDEGQIVELTPELRARIERQNDDLAAQGLRVLGFAFRPLNSVPPAEGLPQCEHDMIFTGLVGMIDPPRAEARDAVRLSTQAGIRTVMITGDHPLTAYTIARDLGIVNADDTNTSILSQIMTGRQLNDLLKGESEAAGEAKLAEAVKRISVFARVSPEHKLRIVRALQKNGEIVSMTGDGVNDAPALRQADIGVAMGITGTAVAREAAEMVILDDNFATIVSAAEEGRTIYDNVRKFIKYILGSNIGEVGVLFATQLLGLPLPINTLQILWMNLVTDGLPALALSVEQGEPNAMHRPPRDPKSSIFSDGLGAYLPRIAIVIFILGMAAVLLVPNNGPRLWSTMVFTTLVISQMGHALAIRSEQDSVFKIGLFSNRAMLGAVGLTAGLQLALIYVPFLNDFFGTTPLTLGQLALCYGAAIVTFAYVEFDKWLFERVLRRRNASTPSKPNTPVTQAS